MTARRPVPLPTRETCASDLRLSGRLSRSSAAERGGSAPRPMRSLDVRRLSVDLKAVFRVSMSRRGSNVFCEFCDRWFGNSGPHEGWDCPRCGRSFEVEFAVYREVEREERS